ncbi:MAG UNVERIFIED_CONTAM: hypothetical protein LVT10_00380 [Anaerolineae bacterium]
MAHDATGTVAEAKRLYRAVNRPNPHDKDSSDAGGLKRD